MIRCSHWINVLLVQVSSFSAPVVFGLSHLTAALFPFLCQSSTTHHQQDTTTIMSNGCLGQIHSIQEFLNYKLISTWVCDENVGPVLNEHDCPTDGLCSYFYLSKDNLAYAILGVFFTHCYTILSKVKFCGPNKILPFTNSKVLFLLHTCEGTSFWYITKASLAQLSPGCGGLTLAGAHPAALSFPHLSWTGERK